MAVNAFEGGRRIAKLMTWVYRLHRLALPAEAVAAPSTAGAAIGSPGLNDP